jgi:hypothetical protein
MVVHDIASSAGLRVYGWVTPMPSWARVVTVATAASRAMASERP